MFQTVSLSIIRSLALYTQQQVYVILKFQKMGKITSVYKRRVKKRTNFAIKTIAHFTAF